MYDDTSFLIGFRIGLPKLHRRFRIALPKMHRRFRIGPLKMHRQFRISPPQVSLNLFPKEFQNFKVGELCNIIEVFEVCYRFITGVLHSGV